METHEGILGQRYKGLVLGQQVCGDREAKDTRPPSGKAAHMSHKQAGLGSRVWAGFCKKELEGAG